MDIPSLKQTPEWNTYHFLTRLSYVMDEKSIRWDYAFSDGQLFSKIWLLQTLQTLKIYKLDNVMILGGWIGLLGSLLLSNEAFEIEKIRSFDLDPKLEKIADSLNIHHVSDNWKFKAAQGDWNKLDYSETAYTAHRVSDGSSVNCTDKFQTIINTSCEHAENLNLWLAKVPSDRLLILQSNSSSEYEGHTDPSSSLEEFTHKAGLSRILFAGALPTRQYTRWMLIGYR